MKRYINRTFLVAPAKCYYDTGTKDGIVAVGVYAYKAGKKWVRFETELDNDPNAEFIRCKVDENSVKEVLYRMPEEDFIKHAEEVG